MTSKQISKRVEQIWTELDEYIAGTGAGALIEELIELEITHEENENLSMLERENKALAKALKRLGYTKDQINDIANGAI